MVRRKRRIRPTRNGHPVLLTIVGLLITCFTVFVSTLSAWYGDDAESNIASDRPAPTAPQQRPGNWNLSDYSSQNEVEVLDGEEDVGDVILEKKKNFGARSKARVVDLLPDSQAGEVKKNRIIPPRPKQNEIEKTKTEDMDNAAGIENEVQYGKSKKNQKVSDQKGPTVIKTLPDTEESAGMRLPPPIAASSDCDFLVENPSDQNYGILESVVMQFPIPFNQYGACNPLIVDFAFPLLQGLRMSPGRGFWSESFQRKLDTTGNPIQKRKDGMQIAYGKIVNFTASASDQKPQYKFTIRANCNVTDMEWLKETEHHYCVLDHECNDCDDIANSQQAQYLHPLHSADRFFFPTTLPAPEEDRRDPGKHGNVRVCVFGESNLELFYDAIVKWRPKNVQITILPKVMDRSTKTEWRTRFKEFGYNYVAIHEAVEYEVYEATAAECHMAAVMMLPDMVHIQHFPPEILSYRIPSVVHVNVDKIFRKYLTATSEVYHKEEAPLEVMMNQMMKRVRGEEVEKDAKGNLKYDSDKLRRKIMEEEAPTAVEAADSEFARF